MPAAGYGVAGFEQEPGRVTVTVGWVPVLIASLKVRVNVMSPALTGVVGLIAVTVGLVVSRMIWLDN